MAQVTEKKALNGFLTGVLFSGIFTMVFACQEQSELPDHSTIRNQGDPDKPAHLPASDYGISSLPTYLNGVNIAWFEFGSDFSHGFQDMQLDQLIARLKSNGGNSLRWWVHVDGSQSPEWQGKGYDRRVVGPGDGLFKNLERALDKAEQEGIKIFFSLWSFDMLRKNDYRNPPNEDNYRLLTDEKVLESYLDHVLTPMVKRFNNHPALGAWELFNEPENMTESWFQQEGAYYGGPAPSLSDLQRVQAKMAAVIHRIASEKDQEALVTTGSKSLGKYNSKAAGGQNLYSDEALKKAAGGDSYAYFDFYAPHYYNNEGQNGRWSPFHHKPGKWELGKKPLIIGEYHVEDLSVQNGQIPGNKLCQKLRKNGYRGGWTWSYYDSLGSEFKKQEDCIRNAGDSDNPLPDYPECEDGSSDPDGDGWGYENKQSCRVVSFPNCKNKDSDPDGDGWGWEGDYSCRVFEYPICEDPSSDPDGDGWGFENNQSCKVKKDPICEDCSSDPDGDGWGGHQQTKNLSIDF